MAEQGADTQWEFAELLFHKGQYYRAITEYERFAFYFPQDQRFHLAKVRTVECFILGRWWREGVAEALKLMGEGSIPSHLQCKLKELLVEGLIQLGRLRDAREVVASAFETCEDHVLRERMEILLLKLKTGEGEGTEGQRASEFKGALGSGRSTTSGLEVGGKGRASSKEPLLAGILASIIPGSGHAYLGRWEDAALVFAVNGAFIAATLEAVKEEKPVLAAGMAAAELLWYSGNIFSAISSAYKYNQTRGEQSRSGGQ